MAITTMDQLAAGILPLETHFLRGTLQETGAVYGSWMTHELDANFPGAAASPSSASGTALTSWTHQIPMPPAVAGKKLYIAGLTGYSAANAFEIIDRLWHGGLFSMAAATAQTVNSVAWPARDRNQSTNGEGVMIAAIGGGLSIDVGVQLTINYTNSNGVANRVGASQVVGSGYGNTNWLRIALDLGDTGVRSIQTVANTGTLAPADAFTLIAYRPVCRITRPVYAPNEAGVATCNGVALGLPEVFDNSVLHWLHQNYNNNTTPGSDIYVKWAQG